MKKNGFTLVELLSVVVILSIIMGIVIMYSMEVTNNRRSSDYENIKIMMLDGAKSLVGVQYDIDNSIDNRISAGCKITYDYLASQGYVDADGTNPTNDDPLSNTCIKVSLDSNYKYS